MQQGGLCNKCLAKGHIAQECPKVNFKCQKSGCGGNHHTLMHRHTTETGGEPKSGTVLKENSREQDQEMPCLIILLGPAMIEKPL